MPDAQRAELAKLEALHAEHPQGRIFTHLAEAYRKAGELERAREVLAEGIQRHPDYSSAHVVLARVLADMGEAAEAAAEFRRVLELDSHNLVALRSLGDIARAAGRREEATDFYNRLLDVEPSDQDVREVLREMEGEPSGPAEGLAVPSDEDEDAAWRVERAGDELGAGQAEGGLDDTDASGEEPGWAVEGLEQIHGAPAEEDSWEPGGTERQVAAAEDEDRAGDPREESSDAAGEDASWSLEAAEEQLDPDAEEETPDTRALERPEEAAAGADEEAWAEGRAGEQVVGAPEEDPWALDRPDESTDAVAEEASWSVEPPGEDPGAAAEEPGALDDPAEKTARAPAEEPAWSGDGADESVGAGPDADEAVPWVTGGETPDEEERWVTGGEAADEVAAESPDEVAGEVADEYPDEGEEREPIPGLTWDPPGQGYEAPVSDADEPGLMTETIAQVYARQGLYEQAAEVYRQLVRARPDDHALRGRLEEMEALAAQQGSAEGASIPGLVGRELESPPEVAPLAGLESDEVDPETGLRMDEEPTPAVESLGDEVVRDVPAPPEEDPLFDEDVEPADTEAEPARSAEDEAWQAAWIPVPEETLAAAEALGELAPEEAVPEEEAVAAEGATPVEEPLPELEPLPEAEALPELEPLPDEEEAGLERAESVWTGGEGASGGAESPYAWAEEEAPAPDESEPIGSYLKSLLGWSDEGGAGQPAEPDRPSPESGPSAGGSGGPGAGEGNDDLDTFRSWLESLKQ